MVKKQGLSSILTAMQGNEVFPRYSAPQDRSHRIWETYRQAVAECEVLQGGRDAESLVIYPIRGKKNASEAFDFLHPIGPAQDMLFRYTPGDGSPRHPFGISAVFRAAEWMEMLNRHHTMHSSKPFQLNILTTRECIAYIPFKSGTCTPTGELFAVGPDGIECTDEVRKRMVGLMQSFSIGARGLMDHLALLNRKRVLKTVMMNTFRVPFGVGQSVAVCTSLFLRKDHSELDFYSELQVTLRFLTEPM